MKFIQSKPFIFGGEQKIERVDEGITRQFYGYDNNLMMVKVIFQKGAAGLSHRHDHVQATYVVSGKFEVTIDDEKHVLVAGDGFFVETDTEHECICLEEGVLIDVFNPAREDFCDSLPENEDYE